MLIECIIFSTIHYPTRNPHEKKLALLKQVVTIFKQHAVQPCTMHGKLLLFCTYCCSCSYFHTMIYNNEVVFMHNYKLCTQYTVTIFDVHYIKCGSQSHHHHLIHFLILQGQPLIHLQIIYQILDFLTKQVSTDQSGTMAANKVS